MVKKRLRIFGETDLSPRSKDGKQRAVCGKRRTVL